MAFSTYPTPHLPSSLLFLQTPCEAAHASSHLAEKQPSMVSSVAVKHHQDYHRPASTPHRDHTSKPTRPAHRIDSACQFSSLHSALWSPPSLPQQVVCATISPLRCAKSLLAGCAM